MIIKSILCFLILFKAVSANNNSCNPIHTDAISGNGSIILSLDNQIGEVCGISSSYTNALVICRQIYSHSQLYVNSMMIAIFIIRLFYL